MKRSMIVFALVVAGMSLSSCATMFNSGAQTIMILPQDNKPAEVVITTGQGSYASKLPATIVADPSTFKGASIEVRDKCYDPATISIGKNITPSFFANIFVWPGFIIDFLTGAMWKYDNHILVPLNNKADRPDSCKVGAGL